MDTDPTSGYSDDIAIPALLRAARGSYGRAIAARLADEGLADLPRNGPFVLGGMANHGGSAVDMIRGLGVSRQAASQLIDTLVLRGYLTREINPADRRRMDIELTGRGRAAADAVQTAIADVDRQLAAMITPTELTGLRTALTALATIKDQAAHTRP